MIGLYFQETFDVSGSGTPYCSSFIRSGLLCVAQPKDYAIENNLAVIDATTKNNYCIGSAV